MIKKNELKIIPVRKSHCPFLFELLKERDSRVNISHRKIPTYNNHVKFVMSKPYSKWYIIQYQEEKIGSVYLSKQDEIGIFIKKGNQGGGIGKKALELLMKKNPRKRYLANVNPKNSWVTFYMRQRSLLKFTWVTFYVRQFDNGNNP